MRSSNNKKEEVKCTLHKWSIHPETNRLQCCTCNFVAGSEHGQT